MAVRARGKWTPWVALLGACFVCAPAAGGDDLATRREQVERMPPAEQQDLLRKQERFAELPLEEQERLRTLQAALDSDSHHEKLLQVLSRYHEWLKTLTPTQRSELADLPPQERVQQIKKIQRQRQMAREQAHLNEVLSKKDLTAIVQWVEDLAWQRRERLLSGMSESQRKGFDGTDEHRQRRILLYRALASERVRRSKGGASLLGVEPADIEKLAGELSPPARQELTEASGLPAQRKLLHGWVNVAVHRLDPSHAGRRLGPLAGEDLARFLQHDVPEPQRERLLKMPREQMLEELRTMYYSRPRGEFGPPLSDPTPWLDRHPERLKGEFRGKGRPHDPQAEPAVEAAQPK